MPQPYPHANRTGALDQPRQAIGRSQRLGSLSLALQGGGSIGAFTWGVLDRLLEEPHISFDTVSGSSAGAINAAVLAGGFAKAGREGAREHLERFWRRASGAASSPSLNHVMAMSARVLSPYQLNPFDLNPLRLCLQMEVDFDLIRSKPPFRLMIGATRVRDGSLTLFDERALSVDVLLASACLPLLNRAITIDGEDYWDGGYAANPPLLPLVEASTTPDILLVQIVPSTGNAHPRSAADIARRLDHMTFNASLTHDLETIVTVKDLVGGGEGQAGRLAACRLHRIAADETLPDLREADAMNLDWSFLRDLRDAGRVAAQRWLAEAGETAINDYVRPSPEAQRADSPSRYVG